MHVTSVPTRWRMSSRVNRWGADLANLPSALVSTKRPFHTRRAAERGRPICVPLCPMRTANAERFLIAVSYLVASASRMILAASVVRASELQSRLTRNPQPDAFGATGSSRGWSRVLSRHRTRPLPARVSVFGDATIQASDLHEARFRACRLPSACRELSPKSWRTRCHDSWRRHH